MTKTGRLPDLTHRHILQTPKDKRFSEQVEKRPKDVLSTKQNTQTYTLESLG